jgi:hypothetical protein
MTTLFENNYFNEIPIDIQIIILKKTIPKPPTLPDPNKKKIYDFDTHKLEYIDALVNYLPTSVVLKKRYNNICHEWNVKSGLIVWANKKYKYSEIKKFNDVVNSFIEDHSNKELQNKMKTPLCEINTYTKIYRPNL